MGYESARDHAIKRAYVALIEPDTGCAGNTLENQGGIPQILIFHFNEALLHSILIIEFKTLKLFGNQIFRLAGIGGTVIIK